MRAPDVAAGARTSTPTSLLDGYRTILDASGVAGSDRPGTRSWVDLANSPDEDRVVISEYHAFGSPSAGFMIRKGDLKLNCYVGYEPELFDLAADPEELHDLSADPAHRAQRADLERALRDLVDPEEVDHRAKLAQRALVERFGGRDAALAAGTVAETPAPPPA